VLRLLARAGQPLAVVSLGALSGAVEAVFLIVVGLAWATRGRAGVLESARSFVEWELRRLSLPPMSTEGPRVLGYLIARLLPALLGAVTAGLLVVGLVLAGIVTHAFATGQMAAAELAMQVVIGSALLAINLQIGRASCRERV